MIGQNRLCMEAIQKMNRWGKNRKPFLFVLDYKLQQPLVLPLQEASENGIFFTFGNLKNFEYKSVDKRQFTFRKLPVPYPLFKKSYDNVLTEIKRGNSFLVNLTFPTSIETDLTLPEIFQRSEAPYRLLFEDQFVVFSPELFVTIKGGTISSFPMKGTSDASLPDAETKILGDIKETAEHHTIVDLIRNDLSLVATNVAVRKFRFINTVRTNEKMLLQVSSEITGDLPADYHEHLGDILFKLLPAGSISGAPKKKTVAIIDQAEHYERGFYTGVFGFFDGSELQSAVMIRFIERDGDQLIFKSGGGITSLSSPETEYQELIDKVYVPIY